MTEAPRKYAGSGKLSLILYIFWVKLLCSCRFNAPPETDPRGNKRAEFSERQNRAIMAKYRKRSFCRQRYICRSWFTGKTWL